MPKQSTSKNYATTLVFCNVVGIVMGILGSMPLLQAHAGPRALTGFLREDLAQACLWVVAYGTFQSIGIFLLSATLMKDVAVRRKDALWALIIAQIATAVGLNGVWFLRG